MKAKAALNSKPAVATKSSASVTKTGTVSVSKSSPASKFTGKGRNALAKKAAAAATAAANASQNTAKKQDKSDSTVIYLGHLPCAFEEKEMREFFVQFGDVKRLKLYRSKKTNRPKGYAFVEFESDEIARTVSGVMNGYFLDNRVIKSNVVPKGRVHEDLFRYRKSAKKIIGSNSKNSDDHEDDFDDSDSDDAEVEEKTKKGKGSKVVKAPTKPKDTAAPASKHSDEEKRAFTKKKTEVALKKKQNKLRSMGIGFEFLETLAVSGSAPAPAPTPNPAPSSATPAKTKGNAKGKGGK